MHLRFLLLILAACNGAAATATAATTPALPAPGISERVKDLASVAGVR